MNLNFVRRLGQGGFGDVWLAEDLFLPQRRYAVKFFNNDTATQASADAHLQGSALARVDHRSVVKIISLEEQPHPETGKVTLTVIMEHVDGVNLSEHRGTIDKQLAWTMIVDLADGLEAIHGANLVHTDLYDKNVMLTTTGAKLIDLHYRWSLTAVGTKTGARTRKEDVRSLAEIVRQILERVPDINVKLLQESYYYAATNCETVPDLRRAFAPLVPCFAVHTQSSTSIMGPVQDAQSQLVVDDDPFATAMLDGDIFTSQDANENGGRAAEDLLRLLQRAGAISYDERAATRWKVFFASADLPLVERWKIVAESLMRAGKMRVLAATWNEAATLGEVPYFAPLDTTVLSGPPDPRAISQIRSEKMACWGFLEQQPPAAIGGRVLARLAKFGWTAGAWAPSHRLAAPLFELMWDTLAPTTVNYDRSGPAELHLWSAAGGSVSLGSNPPVFFPWPMADIPTFSDYRALEGLWNTAVAEVREVRRHFPRDSRIADDLAHYYMECHHALWHPDTARAEWSIDVSPRDWSATLSHLRVSAKQSQLGSPAYGEWTRSLPLLAAPESGLSEHVATAILEATKPDEPTRVELRDLRRRRARICLSRPDVDDALAAIDRASPGHSWSSLVEEPR